MPKPLAQPKSRLNLAIAPDLYERIAREARNNDQTVTAWIVEAIVAKLHQPKPTGH